MVRLGLMCLASRSEPEGLASSRKERNWPSETRLSEPIFDQHAYVESSSTVGSLRTGVGGVDGIIGSGGRVAPDEVTSLLELKGVKEDVSNDLISGRKRRSSFERTLSHIEAEPAQPDQKSRE